jgi:hypothetical protein
VFVKTWPVEKAAAQLSDVAAAKKYLVLKQWREPVDFAITCSTYLSFHSYISNSGLRDLPESEEWDKASLIPFNRSISQKAEVI